MFPFPAPPGAERPRVTLTGMAQTTRERDLKRRYALTEEEYESLLASQGGRCAICRRLPTPGRRFAVDHDHKSLRVRGLLCAVSCNHQLLGRRDRDPELFLRAYEYLTNPPAQALLDESHRVPKPAPRTSLPRKKRARMMQPCLTERHSTSKPSTSKPGGD